MKFNRSSGILLHPTSFAGHYGIGDLGPQALRWIDFLSGTGCRLWQVLPLGPTGFADSPYQCFSAFAGNPYLISPEALLKEDLLHPDDLFDRPRFPDGRVDYGAVINWKLGVLDRSYHRFSHTNSPRLKQEYDQFCQQNATWLDDFALFMALKEVNGGSSWVTWPLPIRQRNPGSVAAARQRLSVAIQRQKFRQFIFFRQWSRLQDYAHEKGIQIIGDVPIFVAHDSADVWARPDLFFLDESGMPTVVAGVPPDYFSPTGQLWGNPLYRWERHASDGFSWWLSRFRSVLKLVDIIRIDHFRGFAGYYEVPGNAPTAEHGRWVTGPGTEFFQTVRSALGDLPILAEDLGLITPDVEELRDSFELPGMRILQFGFNSGPQHNFLPHHYPQQCVVYTGTHDNDTSLGWYQRVTGEEKDFYHRYMNRDGIEVSWDLIRCAWSSVAVFALAPLQDFLGLDNSARMNYPGNPGGNWTWRMPANALTDELKAKIKEINYLYSRDKDTTDE